MTVRIGNGCGFYGDQLDAPRDLVRNGRLDYLTLEYLAELTLSILARQKEKDPRRGFAEDFLYVVESIIEELRQPDAPRIVTNAGGMNPIACAQAVSRRLCHAGLGDRAVAVVSGDDLLPYLSTWIATGVDLAHLDDGRPINDVADQLVSANAYLGARPIVDALRQGADIVITGRVADASLVVAPAQFEFGSEWNDVPALATATVAGHLIECGAQVTGGYTTQWQDARLSDVGYPIAEFNSPTELTITKPPASGGRVNQRTVTEQLLYEVGDPRAYITPDLVLNMSNVALEQVAENAVAVRGATGSPGPGNYKVSAAYRAGYQTSGQLVVFGQDCLAKADAIAQIVFDRVREAGFTLNRCCVEKIGAGESVPGLSDPPPNLPEVALRIAVAADDRAAVERFSRELAPLVTSGPAGIGGYTQARQPVRPVYAFWPALVPKVLVDPRISIVSHRAEEWSSETEE